MRKLVAATRKISSFKERLLVLQGEKTRYIQQEDGSIIDVYTNKEFLIKFMVSNC